MTCCASPAEDLLRSTIALAAATRQMNIVLTSFKCFNRSSFASLFMSFPFASMKLTMSPMPSVSWPELPCIRILLIVSEASSIVALKSDRRIGAAFWTSSCCKLQTNGFVKLWIQRLSVLSELEFRVMAVWPASVSPIFVKMRIRLSMHYFSQVQVIICWSWKRRNLTCVISEGTLQCFFIATGLASFKQMQ
jgi:hypothetical protein